MPSSLRRGRSAAGCSACRPDRGLARRVAGGASTTGRRDGLAESVGVDVELTRELHHVLVAHEVAGVLGHDRRAELAGADRPLLVKIAPDLADEDVDAVADLAQAIGLDGIIATIPVGRLGTAAEMAACVSFLSGADSGFITGATITANGGQYITG